MNEDPKSIWKKSLKGPRSLLLWLIPFTLVFAVIYANDDVPFSLKNYLGLPAYALFFSLFVTLMLWFAIKFVRWGFCWRNFKRFLFGCACLATLTALFYAEEDWRGKHDWEKYKREWETKGEKFDFADFVPPSVPDDQNFAMTPIVFTSYGSMLTRAGKMIPSEKRDKNFVVRMQMSIEGESDWKNVPTDGYWRKGTITDLKDWQNYYRALAAKTNEFPVAPQPQTPAQDVLLALSKYDSTIEELRQASQLPYSRFPLEWDKDDPAAILLPHLAPLKGATRTLQLRAIAELQNGESEKALDDVKLMLYLNQSIRTEPVLISHLVRIAMAEITLQPIYEGLAEHQWSDAQLAELDLELGKLDFLADYEFSMRGERIFGISITEYLRRSRDFQILDYDESGNHDSVPSHIGLRLAPASFFYRNELVIAQMHQQWTLPLVDLENRTVSPKEIHRNQIAGEKALEHGWPYNILARMVFPAISGTVEKYAREQSSIDLARVAIALERFRLAHGEFPDSLDALTPQFMEKVPHDIINGEPLHYRRTDDGQFVLYSVGWNETDDGGIIVFKNGSAPRDESKAGIDMDKGDWVWRYPSK